MNRTASRAAFRDADGAYAWLAAQPRGDASVMLSGLTAQIEALNLQDLSPRGRFKILEVLRKEVFVAGAACRRQCEGRPLPLDADEQASLDAALRLWRAHAVGYQHCLQACLDGDESMSRYVARVAHRVSSCLRMEQLTGYAGGAAPRPGFWESFHTLFLAAEELGCVMEMVEDRLPGETRASSVSGQYATALMLHLAQPFSLSSGQLAVVVRWLARWREHTRIDGQATTTDARYSPIPLDLAADRPIHEKDGQAHLPRWLSLGNVQRKIRQRLDALAAGESPENLNLGSCLSAKNCQSLLERLSSNLRHPLPVLPAATDGMPTLSVCAGLAGIHRLLSGKRLEEMLPADSSTDDPPAGREARPPGDLGQERWRLAHWESNEQVLLRAPGNGASRLTLHGLLAVGRQENYLLAVINALWQNGDGTLFCAVNPLPGGVTPRVAEIRNWMTGEVAYHPAFQLSSEEDRARDRLLLPAGLLVRASGVRFFDCGGELLFGLRVADCLERGDEVEFWQVASND
ncbi:MAG: hypothetical protein LBQ62_05560 [Candidatus Accumulibacter sp.]|nr:hypothetical protein [Accumulibacter sp.]